MSLRFHTFLLSWPKSRYTDLSFLPPYFMVVKRHIKKLNHFHTTYLLEILSITWQKHIPDTEVLTRVSLPSIYTILIQSLLRWASHVFHMKDHILWDDRPIFMISGSNQQLQQQLEYSLLKPFKMQSGREDTLEERYEIKFCFKLEINATDTYGMLQTAFRPSCMNRESVFEWHKRFKEGRVSVRDDERCGRSKEVNRPELIGQRVRVIMLRF